MPHRAERSIRAGLAAVAVVLAASPAQADLAFVEVAAEAGLVHRHVPLEGHGTERMTAGVAAGDYDGDGWIDLYVIGGSSGTDRLFHNRGDGTFEEAGEAAGLGVPPRAGSGATFADVDGDGWLDLLLTGLEAEDLFLFRNRGDGTFEDVTATSGLDLHRGAFSSAFADVDLDGDLDLALGRWESRDGCTEPCDGHLWINRGDGRFVESDEAAGIEIRQPDPADPPNDQTFTPAFADLDADGLPDLLYAADFGTSQVFHNLGGAVFADVTDPAVITDRNGMGAAVGDYDEDGDLDWFVTAIYDAPPYGDGVKTGNRLYRNVGDAAFEEVSEEAGVRVGYWGWGACFGDFDQDGDLDLFHVNGWKEEGLTGDWSEDPSRLFLNRGPPDWGFVESSAEVGLTDTGQGRGVACFDYDGDGDLDLFVANNGQAPALWRNDGSAGSSLRIRLRGSGANRTAVGARVWVTAGGATRLREVGAGSNYLSQQPLELHFGLGAATVAEEVLVAWPDGRTESHADVAAGRWIGVAPGGVLCEVRSEVSERADPGAVTWEACNRLVAGAGFSTAEGAEVTLRAGHSVVFADGAEVGADARLTVEIDPALRMP